MSPISRLSKPHPWRVIVIACLLSSCDGEPVQDVDPTIQRADQCLTLREHLVDLRVPPGAADRDQHRAAIRSALGDAFIADCVTRHDRDSIHCALASQDSESVGACLSGDAP